MENKEPHRWGNFSSSKIHALVAPGKREMTLAELAERKITHPKSTAKLIEDNSLFSTAGLTYILETKWERRLGRAINVDKDSNATLWGKLLEPMVNELLPEEYRLMSKKRFVHPTIENWSGMPDTLTPTVVSDIKCVEPKMFMALLDIFEFSAEYLTKEYKTALEALKSEHPDKYWQLVSNGILTNRNRAELIIFMPKEHRLPEIRTLCENEEDFEMQEKFKRIFYAPAESLALMPESCELQELNIFAFDIPQEDKDLLTLKVNSANKLI